MIALPLTPVHLADARPFLEQIPGVDPRGFWRRVEAGDYGLLLLREKGEDLGLVVISVLRQDSGQDLSVQLATSPGVASRHRQALLRLFDRLARWNSCTRIVFESKRKGWEGVAEGLGFAAEPVTRYTKEVA